MVDDGEGRELVEAAGRRKRGAYSVGPKLRVAIEAMACGRARTIQQAAELSGMSREGLSKALRRSGVREYMRAAIMETLGVGAVRAGHKMLALMEDSENSIVQLGAAKFLLATGAGVVPPSPPSTTVNIGISTERAGFVIDLRDDPSQPLPANWDRDSGVVIDGTAEEVKDVVER